jgi:hypothetical protein
MGEVVEVVELSIVDGPAIGGLLQVPVNAPDGSEIVLHYTPLDIEEYEDANGVPQYVVHGGGALTDPVSGEPLGPMVYARLQGTLVFVRQHHNPVEDEDDVAVQHAGEPIMLD